MTQISSNLRSGTLRARVAAWVAAVGVLGTFAAAPVLLIATPAAHAQTTYQSPDAAAEALTDALARSDHDALRQVLGKDFGRFIPTDNIGEQSATAAGRCRSRSCSARRAGSSTCPPHATRS
jgi:hypothetical protein